MVSGIYCQLQDPEPVPQRSEDKEVQARRV
jgi:hypothetical protein